MLTSSLPDCKVDVKCTAPSTTNMCTNPGYQTGTTVAVSFPGADPLNEVFFKAKIIDPAPVPAGFPFGSDGTANHVGLFLDLEVAVQDWPNAAYSVTSPSGFTAVSTYNTAYPGIGLAGVNNILRMKIAFAACTSTTTFRGCLDNAGATIAQSTVYDIDVAGWRQFTGANAASYKQHIVIGNSTVGVTVKMLDTSNNMLMVVEDGLVTERWTQGSIVAPPAGSTFTVSPINYPTVYAIDRWAWVTWTNTIGGPTSMNLGWSTSPTAIASGLPVGANSAAQIPGFSPIPVAGTGIPILTTVGGNFSVQLTGTATGGTMTTLVDTSQSWTSNQWHDYGLYNITQGWTVIIASSTSNTLTLKYAAPTSATSGDSYVITAAGLLSLSGICTYGII